jgi:hypothetical protein
LEKINLLNASIQHQNQINQILIQKQTFIHYLLENLHPSKNLINVKNSGKPTPTNNIIDIKD